MCVGILAGLAPGVSAETLIVPDQFPSIQAAIDAAVDGDAVLVQPGIYAERIVWWNKAILVRSAGGAAVTAIDTSELGPGSVVSAAVGGAVHVYGGPTFTDCLFENNRADRTGGVYTLNSFALFEGCVFRGNSADVGASALETVFPVGVDVAASLFCAQGNRRSSASGSTSAATSSPPIVRHGIGVG